jgi:GxxExxY protein
VEIDSNSDFLHKELTEAIISAAYTVHNTLGYGFAEKIYENALFVELKKGCFDVKQQTPLTVLYGGIVVGDYVTDLVVNDAVIVEVKAVKQMTSEHETQLLNYLRATKCEVGLLLNFGRKVEIKRMVFGNKYKK